MKRAFFITSCALALVLAGCGEKPQTNAEGVKHDAPAWSGTANGAHKEGGGTAFTASGWKVGDKAAWEAQIKTRGQNGQNEYNRMQ